MKKLLFIIAVLLSSVCVNSQTSSYDDSGLSLVELAKKRQQEKRDSIAEVKRRAEELKRNERRNYQNAINSWDLNTLREFKANYPRNANMKEIDARIAEFDFWNSTLSLNTIAGYNNYLTNSKFKHFASLANRKIAEINSEKEWNAINPRTVVAVKNFLNKYPDFPRSSDARSCLRVLEGEEAYARRDYREAKRLFDIAGYSNLSSANKTKYNSCVEEIAYYDTQNTYSELTLQAFLDNYPNSWHYNSVSDKLAVIKAKKLSGYSSESDYANVRTYAKSDDVMDKVNSEIGRAKGEYKKICRENRRYERRQAGRMVQFAWAVADFDINSEFFAYDMGFGVKFGNYKVPVQFELGIKPGIICFTPGDCEIFFHLPAYTKLKLNLFSAGSSKFFLYGLGEYNIVKEDFDFEYAYGGGLGFSWRRCDWSFYYKKLSFAYDYYDYKDDYYYGGIDWRVGTTVTVYF